MTLFRNQYANEQRKLVYYRAEEVRLKAKRERLAREAREARELELKEAKEREELGLSNGVVKKEDDEPRKEEDDASVEVDKEEIVSSGKDMKKDEDVLLEDAVVKVEDVKSEEKRDRAADADGTDGEEEEVGEVYDGEVDGLVADVALPPSGEDEHKHRGNESEMGVTASESTESTLDSVADEHTQSSVVKKVAAPSVSSLNPASSEFQPGAQYQPFHVSSYNAYPSYYQSQSYTNQASPSSYHASYPSPTSSGSVNNGYFFGSSSPSPSQQAYVPPTGYSYNTYVNSQQVSYQNDHSYQNSYGLGSHIQNGYSDSQNQNSFSDAFSTSHVANGHSYPFAQSSQPGNLNAGASEFVPSFLQPLSPPTRVSVQPQEGT